MYYKLIDKIPVPCTIEEMTEQWSKNRHVAQTEVGCLLVSTIFLVINHSFTDDGPPLVFETMIFGDDADEYQTRCSTWAEAEAMHAEAVAYAVGLTHKADASD